MATPLRLLWNLSIALSALAGLVVSVGTGWCGEEAMPASPTRAFDARLAAMQLRAEGRLVKDALKAPPKPGAPGVEGSGSLPPFPLEPDQSHSLMARWKAKHVYESRVIDDMEREGRWSVSGIGKMEYTRQRAKNGERSLRFRTSLRDEDFLRKHRGPFNSFNGSQGGSSSLTLRFAEPQDWSRFNRVSLWVYVEPTSMPAYSFNLALRCDGARTSATTPMPVSFIQDLKPGQWNLVLWEIPNLQRDRVTSFTINQILRGHDPDQEGIVTYDFDRVELQRVDADPYEGWQVDPGAIALRHVGYRPLEPKVALAADGESGAFEVLKADSGAVVLRRQASRARNPRGAFRLLDFSELREPGSYFLRMGRLKTEPFPIADDVWSRPIFKAVNFFFCQRCGYAVPGIHGVCHQDWQAIHEGVRKGINGGWHDAGDLSQGTWRTAMAVYAMSEIVGQLRDRQGDSALRARVVHEAAWGLEWLLKTRFGQGYRSSWSTMRIYTDNKIGTIDDVIAAARNVPWENFLTAAAEARMAGLLAQKQPDLASRSLKAAEDDWHDAAASRPEWTEAELLEAAWGAAASVELYRATKKPVYAERARQFGRLLVACQQQRFEGIPITGYFFESTQRKRVVHYHHAAFSEAPLAALESLCRAFPEDEHWIDWYAAAVLHGEYFLKRGSRASAPYDLVPNSVWRKSEILEARDARRQEDMLRQSEEGTRLAEDCRLRVFPIAPDNLFHGNTAVHLSATWALAAATRLRGDLEGQDLVAKQLHWVFGGNPFCQSLMYGEGHNFAPLFAYCLKDVVGALPVGMDSMAGDQPYWSGSNYATYKEIWVEPVSRFLGTVALHGVPALVEGEVVAPAVKTLQFRDQRTGTQKTADVDPGGSFRVLLEGGDWLVDAGGSQWAVRVVSGENRHLRLDPTRAVAFRLHAAGVDRKANTVRIELAARGSGTHEFRIRAFNGRVSEPLQKVSLERGEPRTVRWTLQVERPDSPWVVVVDSDRDRASKQELHGSLGDQPH